MASDSPSQPELATKAREGEVSSSSNDDQNPICSAAPSADAVNPRASARTILVPPMNKFTLANQAGKANFSTNPARSADPNLRTSQQPNNNKSFDKNRVPHVSANPGKFASSGADDSLVIRFFSDDESGSESEDGEDKSLKTKLNMTMVNENGRLPSTSSTKSSMSQQATRNANSIPKKSSMSCSFNSSMTKTNRVANSRGAGSSSVGQGSQVKNINSIKRNLASQEHGTEQGVDLNSTKVQDLRQQIALRERELKLKAAAQNKESGSVSDKCMNISSSVTRKSNAASSEVGQLAPKEPDRKRIKPDGSYSKHLNSDGQQKMLVEKPNLPSKDQALENSSLQDRNMGNCSKKERLTKRTESSVVKWERQDRRVDISSLKLPASHINDNSSQPDTSRMQMDPCVVLNQTPLLTNANASTLSKKRKSVDSNPVKNCGTQPPACLLKTSTSGQNLINSFEHLQGIYGDKPSCQASLNLNPWNCLGTVNVADHRSIDMHLVEMEESLDKELDEAQEHRRKCEIEERNALKAYRKSQRALIEANSRCTELYRKRELYSTHFRSLIVNDSNLFLPSRQHKHVGTGVNCGNNVSRNGNLTPSPNDQMQPEYDGCNQPGYDSVTGAPSNLLYQHVNGHSLGSEPCSELDASTSEPLPRNSLIAANGVSFQSNDSNISADEDEETFPLDHETDQHSFKIQQRDQNSVGRENHTDYLPNKNPSSHAPQDSLILESKLRSKLFARLPIRTFSKNGGSSTVEPADEPGTEIDNGSERTQGSNGSVQLSEAQKNQHYDLEGNDKPETIMSELPVQIQSHEKNSSNFHSAADSKDNFTGGHQLTTSIISSPPLVLRSAFAQMKVMYPMTLIESQNIKSQQNYTRGVFNGEGGCMDSEEIQCDKAIANSKEEGLKDICGTEIGTFTHNVAVDPFWPLCMYELRGKCNNDDCPWQHARDFTDQNAHQNQHDDSDSADFQVGLTLHQQKSNGGTELSKRHIAMIPPTYLVGFNMLRSDSHKSVIAPRNGQCWQKQFSICLALSSLLQKDLLVDQPSFRANDGCVEVRGSWNGQTSYFQSGKSIANHLNQALASSMLSLEMALLILSQEADKLEGMKKSLSLLSRAIEVDPTSEALWMMYLLIYYSNIESAGKDDMFSYAVCYKNLGTRPNYSPQNCS
uniref:Putative zinc-finger domain-containing protein n=1 Tax=Populus davidiana TaxID=266767 RepID=A0A6M2F0D2_9ROSI